MVRMEPEGGGVSCLWVVQGPEFSFAEEGRNLTCYMRVERPPVTSGGPIDGTGQPTAVLVMD